MNDEYKARLKAEKEKESENEVEEETKSIEKAEKEERLLAPAYVIDITDEELSYRKKNFKDLNVTKDKSIVCTTCGKDIKSYLIFQYTVSLHPSLGVLLCKQCAEFYGNGDFSLDEDGSDKYCRWCGQGGTLYLCATCTCAFCRPCLKRNFHRSVLHDVEADDWRCFMCDPKPLWDLRAIAAATYEYGKGKKQTHKKIRSDSKRKRPESSDSEKSENYKKGRKQKKAKHVTSDSESEDNVKSRKEKYSKKKENKRTRKNNKSEDSGTEQEDNEETCQYSENEDMTLEIEEDSTEELSALFKSSLEDIVKVANVISNYAKKLLDGEVNLKKIQTPKTRCRLVKKMNRLSELASENIQQTNENFIDAYKAIVSNISKTIKKRKKEEKDANRKNKALKQRRSNESDTEEDTKKSKEKLTSDSEGSKKLKSSKKRSEDSECASPKPSSSKKVNSISDSDVSESEIQNGEDMDTTSEPAQTEALKSDNEEMEVETNDFKVESKTGKEKLESKKVESKVKNNEQNSVTENESDSEVMIISEECTDPMADLLVPEVQLSESPYLLNDYESDKETQKKSVANLSNGNETIEKETHVGGSESPNTVHLSGEIQVDKKKFSKNERERSPDIFSGSGNDDDNNIESINKECGQKTEKKKRRDRVVDAGYSLKKETELDNQSKVTRRRKTKEGDSKSNHFSESSTTGNSEILHNKRRVSDDNLSDKNDTSDVDNKNSKRKEERSKVSTDNIVNEELNETMEDVSDNKTILNGKGDDKTGASDLEDGKNSDRESDVEDGKDSDREKSDKDGKDSDGEKSDKGGKDSDGGKSDKDEKDSDGEKSDKDEKDSDGEKSDKDEKDSDGEKSDKDEKDSDGEKKDKDGQDSDREKSDKDGKDSDRGQGGDGKDGDRGKSDKDGKDSDRGKSDKDGKDSDRGKNDKDGKDSDKEKSDKSGENSDRGKSHVGDGKSTDGEKSDFEDGENSDREKSDVEDGNSNTGKSDDEDGTVSDKVGTSNFEDIKSDVESADVSSNKVAEEIVGSDHEASDSTGSFKSIGSSFDDMDEIIEDIDDDDEKNRQAKMSLLDSCSDDELAKIRKKKIYKTVKGEKIRSSSGSKSKKYRLKPGRMDFDSDCSLPTTDTDDNSVTAENANREDSSKVKKEKIDSDQFTGKFSDVAEKMLKLSGECSIVVEKLSDNMFQKYYSDYAIQHDDIKDTTDIDEVKRLTNLKNLKKKSKKKMDSSSETDKEKESDDLVSGMETKEEENDDKSTKDSDTTETKVDNQTKTSKKTKEKKAEESLKDFQDMSESECSVHSNESNDEVKKNPLKVILDNLDKKRNKLAEQQLLQSSENETDASFPEELKEKKKKKKEIKEKKDEDNDDAGKLSPKREKEEKKTNKISDSSSENEEEIRKKKHWRKDKLLCMKLSETDTSDEERRWNSRKEREKKEKEEKQSDSDGPHGFKKKFRKKRARRMVNSDSDEVVLSSSKESESEDSDVFKPPEKSKRKRNVSTSSSSKSKKSDSDSDKSVKKKTKRRRIKKPAVDSDSDSDGDVKSQKIDDTPTKGRKNIRRVLKDDDVADATRKAAKEEEDRRKRIAEKQKIYNEIYLSAKEGTEVLDKLVLDFDPETKEELVKVDEKLVTKLKPHQVKGIKFMWDACFESLKRIKESSGSGCILAHCMGLGKTFQVVTLTHTLLKNENTQIETVLVVCPLSTVLNWVNEFNKWLDSSSNIEVYELTKYKQVYERTHVLREWHENGGVMVLSYDMYRNLSNPAAKRQRKKALEIFMTTLVDPGPDLVVCDEGHLLKNEDTALSKAMRRIKTLRRIVLTGTPLQNNLQEYHCMVQFVKPNLLGTRKEFLNRFVNPINNGQYENSTSHDVKIMKRRAHVLHKMLEGCVQRYDYSVLTPFLPPKFEYALSIRLTELQIKLYKHYLEHFGQKKVEGVKSNTATLFKDFQALQRVWTHPRVLLMKSEQIEKQKLMESESEGSLKDFIDDDSDTTSPSSSSSSSSDSSNESGSNDSKKKKGEIIKKWKSSTRSGRAAAQTSDAESVKSVEEISEEISNTATNWWRQYITNDEIFDDIKQSGKLYLLFTLISECEKLGDKVLVFSQSLSSLNLIEYFLAKIDEANQNEESKENLCGFKSSWSVGLDYFRLDGSSSSDNRSAWCKTFNRDDNHRARLFLISTRAGGLGINLFAANRVIIFDASWNPSHDLQSIFRVFRFGQKKPCYIYRFLAQCTMEEKVYSRQITKLSLACRVVDEQQIERHYTMDDLQELYIFNPEEKKNISTPMLPKDILLAEILKDKDKWIDTFHEHDSLLENKEEEELNEEERKAAWEEYEKEKKGIINHVQNQTVNYTSVMNLLGQMGMSYQQFHDSIVAQYPNMPENQIQEQVNRSLRSIYDYYITYQYQQPLQTQQFVQQPQQFVQQPQQIVQQPQQIIQQPQQQLQMVRTLQPVQLPHMTQKQVYNPAYRSVVSHVQQPHQQAQLSHQTVHPQTFGTQNQPATNRSDVLERLLIQQKEANISKHPSHVVSINDNLNSGGRLKVKSFGHMLNSNFTGGTPNAPATVLKHTSTVQLDNTKHKGTDGENKTGSAAEVVEIE